MKPLESPFIIVPLCLFTLKIKNNHVYAINDKRGNRGSAYKDFLEIRGRVEIAKDKFVQRVRCTPPGFWALHSLQETHTLQTRSKNTWTVYFYYLYTTPAGAVKVSSMIYTSLPGDEGTDYLFMNNLDRFRLERVSSRFSRQYEERYIDPNQIQLNGLLPAIYFMRLPATGRSLPTLPIHGPRKRKRTNISSCRSKDHGGEAGGACGDLPYFLRAGTAG